MNNLHLQINILPELYLKNPDTSKLGRKIISNSITLINKLGFEKFTFKKLSVVIHSQESSIYRYFSNKHSLLIYLTNWYWSWIHYKIVLATLNIDSPLVRLDKCLKILTEIVNEDKTFSYINEVMLNKIIINESVKAYHTKAVDFENKKGYFNSYIMVVTKIADIIIEIKPKYKNAHILISTLIEGIHQQRYFAEHIPELSDNKKGEDTIAVFFQEMIYKICEIELNK